MPGRFLLGQKLKSVVERLKGSSEPEAVRVDRDQLRTTLMQCEFEVRDMHRLLDARPKAGSHRVALPSCRY